MKIPVILTALCCVTVLAADNPFVTSELVPDVIDAPPENELKVDFGNGNSVSYGNELTPTQVSKQPSLSWPAESGQLFTVFMVDPDAPSRTNTSLREYLHFMVGNVPDNDMDKGTTLAPYMGSAPPKDSGFHRYTLLVYKQPGKIETSAISSRAKFSVRNYTSTNQLGGPVAGNFFRAQYENGGGKSVAGSAMGVLGFTVIGLYLSWNW